MTSEQRADIERVLDERAARLARIRAAMVREADGMRDSELAHVDNHPADLGTDLHDEELDETAGIFFDEEERRIAEARRALAAGSYGVCVVCGRPIEPERLSAVPEAVRCIDDQRRFEGRHRQQTRYH
jgi:RNA polymerase-binding transcription factor DksA